MIETRMATTSNYGFTLIDCDQDPEMLFGEYVEKDKENWQKTDTVIKNVENKVEQANTETLGYKNDVEAMKNDVQQLVTDSTEDLILEGNRQVARVSTEGTTQVDLAKAEVTKATEQAGIAQGHAETAQGELSKVTAEGVKQVKAVSDKGVEQVQAVATEGAKQVNLAKTEVIKAEEAATLATTEADRAGAQAKAEVTKATPQATVATEQAGIATTKSEEATTQADRATREADRAGAQAQEKVNNKIGLNGVHDDTIFNFIGDENSTISALQIGEKTYSFNGGSSETTQLTPLFANDISECTDTTKLYVLPDGYVYAYMKTITEGENIPNFTNVMDNPSAYIKEGYRYSLSGAEFKIQPTDCSIVIPVPNCAITIRVRGAKNDATYNNYLYCGTTNQAFPMSLGAYTRIVEDNGDIVITNSGGTDYTFITFAVASGVDEDELIVTINEEITYTKKEDVISYKWANTGIPFIPADYEERMVNAENKIVIVEEKCAKHENRIVTIEKALNNGITMYIAPNGSDNNDGLNVDTPKKTVASCVNNGASRISALRGVYNEIINLANIDTLEIFPTDNGSEPSVNVDRSPIIFDTSDTIAICSLTSHNSIKKIAYSKTNECFNYVFTENHYDKYYGTNHGYYATVWLITDNIKNDIKLKPVATVALCEAETNTFTWVNDTIYINADLTHVNEIRVPTVLGNTFTVINSNKVKLIDVEVKFAGRYNIFIQDCAEFELDNCLVKYSNSGSGFDVKKANGTLRNCYASRVHDGYGITGYGHTNFIDCVAEWCFDDGISHHIGSTGTVIGGRFEGNVKAGNAPAYGAKVNIYGGLYKNNGMRGIWYCTDSQTHDGSTGIIQNAVMVGNPIGLMVDNSCAVTALDCKYVDNETDKSAVGTLIEY